MGMLNSLHRFFVPALAPAAFNVATIVCAFALVPVMPAFGLPRITAIAIGAVAGGIGQVALQWPLLRREGFAYRPVFDPNDRGLREVLLLMGPGTIGLAATQINNFVNTLLATTQGTGAVSWLTYAFRVMYLPLGIFGVSIGTAMLPMVSRHAAVDDVAGIRHTLSRALAMMLIVNVPATFGLLFLSTPIVQLLFERGHFLPADTAATATAVRMYAIGLVGYSAARIVSPAFYAIGRSRVPVIVSVVTIGFNVVLSVTFVRAFGFAGLALSTSIAAIANGGALVWLLRRHLGGIEGRALTVVLIKVSLAALAMAFAAAAIENGFAGAGDRGFAIRAAALAAAIVGALVVLAITSKLLRLAEFDEVLDAARARVRKLLEA
jgi:putative peptidoglycan lipid II flippase